MSTSSRWHSDGTHFAAPKSFNQVYIIHAYKDNGHMLPCTYYHVTNNLLYDQNHIEQELPSCFY